MRMPYSEYDKQYHDIKLKDARHGKYPCFYCGVDSNSIDHFIPQAHEKLLMSLLDVNEFQKDVVSEIMMKQKFIPACKECNSLASDGIFKTPDDKKSFVKAKLWKRYRKIVELPAWTNDEIMELDYNLSGSVKGGLHDQIVIKNRLRW